MTLRGRKNHYNIKFLKGYGFSVKLHNKKIQLKNNYDPFSEPQTEEYFIHKLPYEKIVLQGNGYISTEALKLLTENGRQLLLVDHEGNPSTMMNGLMSSWTSTDYRIGQYDTFRDKTKCEYLSRQIVKAKLESQIKFLESTKNPEIISGLGKIKDYQKTILNDPNQLSFEAKIARAYFTEYAKLFPIKYNFDSRNQSKIRISKNNATDVINGLLNYGYAVLASEIAKFVNGMGLDPYYGFYHKRHSGFQALVYDLIEPFRWLVDYSVYSIANHKDSRKRIKLNELAHDRNGSIRMNYDLIRRFLELLERNFVQERRYDFRHGAKTQDGLKSVQEITIAKIMVQNLVEYCTGKQKEFLI
ncbi:MAG: CRISPR-associated endonuclease Cas1 [Candidatus Nitrosopumilus sp. bin_68KS]